MKFLHRTDRKKAKYHIADDHGQSLCQMEKADHFKFHYSFSTLSLLLRSIECYRLIALKLLHRDSVFWPKCQLMSISHHFRWHYVD